MSPAGTPYRRRTLLGVVAVVVLVVGACLLLATGLGQGDAVAESPLVGRPAPDFTLPAVPGTGPGNGTGDSTRVRLSDLRGQVVLVNFWASWCTECRNEQADLNRLWDRYRDAGVVVVGVDFQDATGDARDFVARTGASYPVVADRRSQTALAYGVRGIPESYLVGPDGRLVDRVIGAVHPDRLGRRIDALLDGARS
jgi:cytochrome c biogenesis protein CcmG, thiol:disulfide interchange protein DsbE